MAATAIALGAIMDRLTIGGDRLPRAPLLLTDEPQIIVDMGTVGACPYRPFEFPRGLVEPSERLKRRAEVGMGLGMVGVQRQSLPIRFDRLIQPPLKLRQRAERVIGLRRRRQTDGMPAFRLGLRQSPRGFVDRRHVGPEIGEIGAKGNGLANQFDGSRKLLALVGDQSEQMQAVGMVGIVPQDSAIERFRGRQVAGAMMADGGG